VDLLHDSRGLDDHPFDAEVGVLLHFAHYQRKFIRRNLGVEGHPDLSLIALGQAHSLAYLAVLHFPGAFAAAEALGPDVHGIGAVGEDGIHHLQAAAGG